jgi:hypothetical protein
MLSELAEVKVLRVSIGSCWQKKRKGCPVETDVYLERAGD